MKTPIRRPEWLNMAVWTDWVQHRREIRKPLKPTTVRYQIAQLTRWHEAGHDTTAILETSIRNGWAGLFEPDEPPGAAHRLPAHGAPGVGAFRPTASERRGAYGYDDARAAVLRARALRLGSGSADSAGDA